MESEGKHLVKGVYLVSNMSLFLPKIVVNKDRKAGRHIRGNAQPLLFPVHKVGEVNYARVQTALGSLFALRLSMRYLSLEQVTLGE
jgi:hypothetical protein